MHKYVLYRFGEFEFFRQPNGAFCLRKIDQPDSALYFLAGDLADLQDILKEELPVVPAEQIPRSIRPVTG